MRGGGIDGHNAPRGAGGRPSGTDAVPPQRDRTGQGLVLVRRLRLLVHGGEPGHAGHVLQPGSVRLRTRPLSPVPVDPHCLSIAVTFLAIAYAASGRRDAARRGRLRLVYAGPRRVCQGSITGVVVGGSRDFSSSIERTRARRYPRVDRPAVVGLSWAGASSAGWRGGYRLCPGCHGLVVHPRHVGADLRSDPQARSCSSQVGGAWVGLAILVCAVFRVGHTGDARRFDHRDHPDGSGLVAPGWGGASVSPALVGLDPGARRSSQSWPYMLIAVLSQDLSSKPPSTTGQPANVRRRGAPTRRPSRRQPRSPGRRIRRARPARVQARGRHCCSRSCCSGSVPELGLDATAKSAGPATSARS